MQIDRACCKLTSLDPKFKSRSVLSLDRAITARGDIYQKRCRWHLDRVLTDRGIMFQSERSENSFVPPRKPSPRKKNWLTIGSIAFGVSCGCSLLFTQDLGRSIAIGIATLPGTWASLSVQRYSFLVGKSRQRQRQLQRGRLWLRQLKQHTDLLDRQIQLKGKDRQAIESRIVQLQQLTASLNAKIEGDRQEIDRVQDTLNALTHSCLEKQHTEVELDLSIQDKQADLLRLESQLETLDRELAQLADNRSQIQAANERTIVALRDVQLEIDRSATIKHDLEWQIRQLEYQQQTDTETLQTQIAERQSLANELERNIATNQTQNRELKSEIDRLHKSIADLTPELNQLTQKIATQKQQSKEIDAQLKEKQKQLNKLESNHASKQEKVTALDRRLDTAKQELADLDRQAKVQLDSQNMQSAAIAASMSEKQQNIAALDTEIATKIATVADLETRAIVVRELEQTLSTKQERLTELDLQISTKNTELELQNLEVEVAKEELSNLEDRIDRKLELLDEIDADLAKLTANFDPQAPSIDRPVATINGQWHELFSDNPHLSVLQHIEKHGIITEAEASGKLGNPRSVRQFANKLEEYTPLLPFAVRVESSPTGNRYIKEDKFG